MKHGVGMQASIRLIFNVLGLGLLLLQVVACSSGSGNASLFESGKDNVSPKILEAFPKQTDIDIETDQELTLIFSELMDHDSLRSAISLIEQKRISTDLGSTVSTEVPATIEIENLFVRSTDELSGRPVDIMTTKVSVIPASGRLALDRRYALEVDVTAKDISEIESEHPLTGELTVGNFLPRSFSVNYDTLTGSWSNTPEELPFDMGGDVYAQALATSSSGDPIVFFAFTDASSGLDGLTVSVFDGSSDTWRSATGAGSYNVIPNVDDSIVQGAIFRPKVLAGDDGTLLLIWQQKRAGSDSYGVFFNYFNGNDWMVNSQEVSDPLSVYDSEFPQVAVINGTQFLLAWSQETAAGYIAQYRLLLTEEPTELGAVSTIPGSLAQNMSDLQLNHYGPKVRIFWKAGDEVEHLYSALFSVSSGFNSPSQVSKDITLTGIPVGRVDQFHAATNSSGDGFVAWSQFVNGRRDLYKATIQNDLVANAELVEFDDRGDAVSPHVVVNEDGVVHILWIQDQQADASLVDNHLLISSFIDQNGWSSRVAGRHSGNTLAPSGSFDAQGNFYAFWGGGGNNSRQSLRYSAQELVWGVGLLTGVTSGPVLASSDIAVRRDGRMMILQLALIDDYYEPYFTLYDLPRTP